MGIIIREKTLKKKGTSLYLDICHGGNRYYEFLHIYLLPGNSPQVKAQNREYLKCAELIKTKRWSEILNNEHGIDFGKKSKDNLLDYFNSIVANMEKGSNRTIFNAAVLQLTQYQGKPILNAPEVTERYLEGFYDHLMKNCHGETSIIYFKKIKKLLDLATKGRMFTVNPANDIRGRKYEKRVKPTLTEAEIGMLINTECFNPNIKYAFIFSCNTGLRFCDVKLLKWNDIKGSTLTIIQQKTKNKISFDLSKDALTILAHQLNTGSLVFSLPTHAACLRALHKWVKDAGIAKKIGWHNSRHTFGTLLTEKGVDIYTTSKLLGHSSIAPTQRYVRESDRLKNKAISKLPELLTKK